MSVWDEIVGQPEAVATLRAAASGTASGTDTMTHAWLITGPPGSGRSNLAYAFATALLSSSVDGDPDTTAQVTARSHPDLTALSTSAMTIKIEDVRETVRRSYYAPSVSRYRVVIVEDADRMIERTSNTLLKALEEPPAETVWILCAPSEADLLPTIRSRVRSVRLRTPSVDDIADLLHRRDGIDRDLAEQSARQAQSHIGMARRLATDADARTRREETLRSVLDIRDVSDAIVMAAKLVEIAGEDAKAYTGERDEQERERVLRSLGVEPGGTIPPALRAPLRDLENDQKRRAKRGLVDGVDRILTDLLSLYRDLLMYQMGRTEGLINRELLAEIRSAASTAAPETTMQTMDAIQEARERIGANITPTLALEAMLVTAIR
ncbi:DNA polymerase III subunit delta' [Mycetocola tolaasinivorans]|uniref:DNA polymerase III subunit delta n=1 Tax=Mycetocola tolaasinivorans TaxID=76635 RepID=A0A3L7A2C5_9MICO|nr:DNA polymerase III subunit delta' [Mycetocola tolaasinivorans]RLP74135.1 DNA polymerase III subunit delta' [Mycetocola tolaasinivorans]